ncbi:adenylate/guanylate cyclase domain-containing protein [Thalassococcus sp. S3]|uniref:adenylate/guanylate cyclase domain-containing protein n=1 Tax=Thalassococcus sp. S3 TaxID=2017482 RepID=UPI00102401BF|nr:adenylate/guanylate cyclase domain-containing protein [Thalassococcus sp. S3]QBF34007.1 hypothetical protein CFI11_22765 [Thalassococcus sp. S3]
MMRAPSLRVTILTLFLVLTVPVFLSVFTYSYFTSSKLVRDDTIERIALYQADVDESIENFFREVVSKAESAAIAGSLQADFYLERSAIDYLTSVTLGTPGVLSTYVGLEADGSFLQARRMQTGQRVNDQDLPPGSVFARRWITADGTGTRIDTYAFEDAQGEPLGQLSNVTAYDPRLRMWYEVTRDGGEVTISDPDVFAALGLVGFTVAAPIYWDQELGGIAAIDLTLDSLSAYLARQSVSPASASFILDQRGNVLANSDKAAVFPDSAGALRLPHITEWPDPIVGVAYGQRPRGDENGEPFLLQYDGQDYLASLKPITTVQDKAWQVFVIAPMADFNTEIASNNRRMLMIGIGATILQIFVIWLLAQRIARPLEMLVRDVEQIRDLSPDPLPPLPTVRIREIALLSRAVGTLDTAIRSFASFVPVGLVRQLLQSEQKLEIGGNSRFLTVFFSDIEGFSEQSENLPSRELLMRVSDYLSILTGAVNDEAGTIDKFIGDGVMAFWGAPTLLEDHAKRACLAALRVQIEVKRLGQDLMDRGMDPLNVRIGIHSDAVLVGNIGSADRMSYTVLGDGVNVASRLEAMNKTYGTRICISHTVYREAGEILCTRPIGDVTIKGRRGSVTIYELLGAFEAGAEFEPDEQTLSLALRSRDAYARRAAGDLEEAQVLYRAILEDFPDDGVARAALDQLEDDLASSNRT